MNNRLNCCFHNIEEIKISRPRALETIKLITDSYRYKLAIKQCPECKQLYLHCYLEVFDDNWDFWTLIDEREVAELSNNEKLAVSLINSRRHAVLAPYWKSQEIYWHEGEEIALTYGPRSWF